MAMIVVQHAKDRALEHHGLVPSQEDWSDTIEQIRKRKGLLIRRDSYSRNGEVWSVMLAGTRVFVAYCPKRDMIITVLPSGLSLPRARNKT